MDKFVLKSGSSSTPISRLGLSLKAACPIPISSSSVGTFELFTIDSPSINLSGAGTLLNPLKADVIRSSILGNGLVELPDGLFVPGVTNTGPLSGGDVTWTGTGLIFDVSETVYNILGTSYDSDYTTVTLTPADPSEDRIDVFYVDNNGLVGVLTGVAEPNPVKPQIDHSTQIELTSVYIPSGSLIPLLDVYAIYNENVPAEWDGSNVGATVNFSDIISPQLGLIETNVTNTVVGDEVQYSHSSTVDLGNFQQLSFFIKLKQVIPANNHLEIYWKIGNTPVGAGVIVPINKNNTSSYQGVSIPLSLFSLVNSNVDGVVFYYNGSDGATHTGFFIDNVYLSSGIDPVVAPYVYTSSNAITQRGNNFSLGGNLTETTTSINNLGKIFKFTGFSSNGYIVNVLPNPGQSGIFAESNIDTSLFTSTGATQAGIIARNSSVVVDSVVSALKIQRTIGTPPSAGIGAAIEYMISPATAGFAPLRSNRLISSWTDEGIATRTSEFLVTGVQNAVEVNLFSLQGSGAARLYNYGDGLFTGTATRTLQVDTNGNIIEGPATFGISGITADNGLTNNTSTNVRFGGLLMQPTTINTGGFTTIWTGANTGVMLNVINSSSGAAINASSTSNTAVTGQATTGKGGEFQSIDGNGVEGVTTSASSAAGSFVLIPATTGTVRSIVDISRLTSGSPINGIGGALTFNVSTTVGGRLSNELISKWTTVNDATRVSEFSISGVDNAATSTLFILSGNGALRLNKYGVNTFTGTFVKYLAVTSAGNVIEVDAGAGGEVISANNGLTENVPGNVQLGGAGIQNTNINWSNFAFTNTWNTLSGSGLVLSSNSTAAAGSLQKVLDITSSGANTNSGQTTYGISASNAHTGTSSINYGISGLASGGTTNIGVLGMGGTGVSGTTNAVGGTGTTGFSSDGFGTVGQTSSGYGLLGVATTGIPLFAQLSSATTGTMLQAARFLRQSNPSSSATNGTGIYIALAATTNSNTDTTLTELKSRWTDITHGSRTNEFIITGVNNAVTADLFTLSGNGKTIFNKYGINTFAGTPVYALGVLATGEVVEFAVGGGGGSGTVNAGAINTLAYYPAAGTTVDDLPAITANRALISDANGLPVASTVTNTTLSFLDATSSVQTQLNAKQATLSGTGIVKSTAGTISYLADPLPIANGGTGSATQNFVDLSTAQTGIAGNKSWTGTTTMGTGTGSSQLLLNGGDNSTTNGQLILRSSSVNKLYFSAGGSQTDIYAVNHNLRFYIDGLGALSFRVAGGAGITYNSEHATTGKHTFQTASVTRAIIDNTGLNLGVAGTTLGVLKFNGNTSGTVTVNTAAAAGTWTFTLPTSGGTNGYLLSTNGSGITSWIAPGAATMAIGSAITSGTDGSVLFVDAAGNLGQDNNAFKWDATNNYLGMNMGAVAATDFLQVGGSNGSIQFGGANGRTLTARNSTNTGYDNFDFAAIKVAFIADVEISSNKNLIMLGATSGSITIAPPAVSGTTTLTLPAVTGTLVQYITTTTASSATPTPTGDAKENNFTVTALAANATFGAPTGTATNMNTLIIRVKDNGTARTLAFNAIYRAGTDIAFPTTTVINQTMYLQFVYNSADTKWDLIGLTQGF